MRVALSVRSCLNHSMGCALLGLMLLTLSSCAQSESSLLAPAATPTVISAPHPTLADFWEGRATFVIDIEDTGLPMGESETLVGPDGALWSYVHASHQSAGVIDSCGDPVPFPGCVVIYRSTDGGRSFQLEDSTCLLECNQCPCTSKDDHVDQQQYPRVEWDGERYRMVYEYRAMVMTSESQDGIEWTPVEQVPATGIWHYWFRDCTRAESIGVHPHAPYDYQCLVGGPPGLFIENGEIYIFVGLGRNPGAMGCYRGPVGGEVGLMQKCENNPLFGGVEQYGVDVAPGPDANPFFDFRTISSAELMRIGERVYMLYEGVRGPGPGAGGDTQFGLGMARTLTDQVDGPWETYEGNPILVDQPGNVGLGHADLIVLDGVTYVYTSLDGEVRSRLRLEWN